MSAKEKQINVKITAKDEASRQLETAMNKVRDVAKVAFTAVAGAVALSVNAAAKFEKGMNNVYTLVDRNKEAFRDMEGDIKDMATRIPVSIEQLTDGLYDVRSAGIDAANAMGVLEKSAMLGVAGLGSTKEAVGIATSAINAFKLEGKAADKAFNTIFLTVKAGKTTISELSQSFGMVAGIAATAGIKFEELQAATAALTTTGQKASVAQTQLKSAILAISAPTTGMIELMKKAGIADGAAALKKDGLIAVMGKLDKAAGGNMETLKGAYGSVEALGAAVSLTGKQANAFETALKSMQGSGEITEDVMKELTEAFELQKETFSAQSEILKNQVNIAMIELGSIVMPILIEKMQALAEVLDEVTIWWANLDQEAKDNIVSIVEWTGAIIAGSIALNAVVKTLMSFKALLGGLQALSTVVAGLTAISVLQFAGIGALIIGLTWIVMNWGDVSNGLEEIAKWLGIIGETSREAERSLSQLQKTSVRVGDEVGTKTSVNTKYYGAPNGPVKDADSYMGITAEARGAVGKETISAGGGGILDSVSRWWNGYADGGRPPTDRPSIVGERGAEVFWPDAAGTIIPNHELGGGKGGVVINITGNQFLDRNGAEQILELAFEKFKMTNKFSS